MTLSRREFVRVAAGAVAASMLPDAKASAADEAKPIAGLPKLVIDTHTHFYDPRRPEGIPWPGKGDPFLYKPMLPETFQALTKPLGVTGTVVVEASPRLEDNQWLLDLAAKSLNVMGIVGNLTPGMDTFSDNLKRFAKDRFYRGFRINGGKLLKDLDDPVYVADLKVVAALDLELDVNGGPDMLPGIAATAEKVPDLRIVINHVANLRNDGKTPDPAWRKGMEACATRKNVFCKVSALAEGATEKKDGRAPTDTAYYVPLLDAVWNVWGEDRLIYASNWPVSERAASYADMLRVVAEYFSGKGKTAAEKFFAGNAKTAYKWIDRSST